MANKGNRANHKGNRANLTRAGRGRPKGAKNKRTLLGEELFSDICTPERMREIVEAMINAAVDGDMMIAKYICDRMYGTPKQSHQISGNLGIQEVKFVIHGPTTDGGNGKLPRQRGPVEIPN